VSDDEFRYADLDAQLTQRLMAMEQEQRDGFYARMRVAAPELTDEQLDQMFQEMTRIGEELREATGGKANLVRMGPAELLIARRLAAKAAVDPDVDYLTRKIAFDLLKSLGEAERATDMEPAPDTSWVKTGEVKDVCGDYPAPCNHDPAHVKPT